MNIRTILFDLDGTLIDTNELIIASFEHTFRHFQLPYTREEIKQFNGPPLRDTFYSIDPVKAESMISTYREHNIKHHDSYVTPFPNVVAVLEQLEKYGIRLGIVSAKMRKSVQMGLTVTEIERFFESVITDDEVDHPKPHPEPVMKAMEDLHADATSTLMVGDNYHDIESGKNAGVHTAGVAWTHKGKDFLQQYHPTYMLEDMRDLLEIIGV